MKKIKKNKLSKAIYLMQKALLLFEKDTVCETSWNLLTVTSFLLDLCPWHPIQLPRPQVLNCFEMSVFVSRDS